MTNKLVKVTWWDHASKDEWMSREEAIKDVDPVLVSSVGYLLREGDRWVTIAGSLASDEDVSQVLAIHKGSVDCITFFGG